MDAPICPRCNKPGCKVIYAGFPMKWCPDERCSTVWGFWAFVPAIFFNGAFMAYKGSYWYALKVWFTADVSDEDD